MVFTRAERRLSGVKDCNAILVRVLLLSSLLVRIHCGPCVAVVHLMVVVYDGGVGSER